MIHLPHSRTISSLDRSTRIVLASKIMFLENLSKQNNYLGTYISPPSKRNPHQLLIRPGFPLSNIHNPRLIPLPALHLLPALCPRPDKVRSQRPHTDGIRLQTTLLAQKSIEYVQAKVDIEDELVYASKAEYTGSDIIAPASIYGMR
jgi:hypothetical protein